MECKECKSYSRVGEDRKTQRGWCMRLRRTVREDDFCAYYRKPMEGRYEMECKPTT